ncbi:hypothetical protein AVEN_75655-1 [Araneus ventricosus]|uniref:Uncharacterized protein n=1 Tax=Araneus ventricosus TaxID=182803 RepID=A0A4Y2D4K0_ARAVE|nr:hypothetical protein AVEN_75655-1 [Araneus ventricosus]
MPYWIHSAGIRFLGLSQQGSIGDVSNNVTEYSSPDNRILCQRLMCQAVKCGPQGSVQNPKLTELKQIYRTFVNEQPNLKSASHVTGYKVCTIRFSPES